MTQREYEEQRYLILAGVDEAFKSLQVLAADLKNAEDTEEQRNACKDERRYH